MPPFRSNGNTVNIDVSASSQRVKIGQVSQVRLMNNGSATVWFAIGGSAITADATTGQPAAPGFCEVQSIPPGLIGSDVYVAVIAAGATGKIYFTPGMGI